MKRLPIRTDVDCRREFDRMLKNSQTKVIMPAVGFGLLRSYLKKRQVEFQDSEIKAAYQDAVRVLKKHIGHDLHIGGKYEDAYGMRMSRYGFLSSRGHLRHELNPVFSRARESLERLASRTN